MTSIVCDLNDPIALSEPSLPWPILLSVVAYPVARKGVKVDPMEVVQIVLEGEASSLSSGTKGMLELFCLFVLLFVCV